MYKYVEKHAFVTEFHAIKHIKILAFVRKSFPMFGRKVLFVVYLHPLKASIVNP